MERKAFLDQPAPAGYVAGLGRGSAGFTTRSDLGPARLEAGLAPADLVSDDEGLFADADEDLEADRIYAELEERMSRSRGGVEAVVSAEPLVVANQFDDLKRSLATVSSDQWANLPEAGDMTKRNKRQRALTQAQQRTYAMPDAILTSLTTGSATEASIDTTEVTDFESISRARDQMLGHQLDLNAGGTTRVEAALYFDNKAAASTDEIADLRKTRAVFRSLRRTAPLVAQNWIMSARVEESGRRFDAARRLINEGCAVCKFNEDVWCESLRLHASEPAQQRRIVTEALRFNRGSIKLWHNAIDLEQEHKQLVVRKAIEANPRSIELWKIAVALEPAAISKRKLLQKAVYLIPLALELWVMLIQSESTLEGKKQWLAEARKSNPHAHEIWLEAMKLEEQSTGNDVKIAKLFTAAVRELETTMTLDAWLAVARTCVPAHPLCGEVIARTIFDGELLTRLEALGAEAPLEESSTRLRDAVREWGLLMTKQENHAPLARAMNAVLARFFPQCLEIWLAYLASTKLDVSETQQVFQEALKCNPTAELLWLMYAKSVWRDSKDLPGAMVILEEALGHLPHSEDVWLARIKLATTAGDILAALGFFVKARSPTSPRLWYKNVHLLRVAGSIAEAQHLVNEALALFNDCEALHLQKAQMAADPSEARETLVTASKRCPHSAAVWLQLARLDEQAGVIIRARSTLDQAVLRNPSSVELWVEKIELEARQGHTKQARALSVVAHAKFPKAAAVWCAYLRLCEKASQRRNGMMDALLKTENSPQVLCFIALQFWKEGKIAKAKVWFERAVQADPSNGDHWAWKYIFTREASPAETEALLTAFANLEVVNQGRYWNETAKDVGNHGKARPELLLQVAKRLESKRV